MTDQMNRRMFLRGAGGAALAIPFLPSLTTRAFAQEAPVTIGPRFCYMRTGHGDVWGANMYPSDALLTQTADYAGRQVRYGALPTVPVNGETSLNWSPVCRGRTDYLTPSVAAKVNILRGVDVPYSIGHQGGINLGNVGASSISVSSGLRKSYATPTIDQAMAYSAHFYSQQELASRVLRRSFSINGGLSFGYSQASTQSGNIIASQPFSSSEQLYNYLFNGASSLAGWNNTMLNRGGASTSLQHPRLSGADRVRLEQHMTRMADLERLLGVSEALVDDVPESPGSLGDSQAYHRNNQLRFAEMYVDAFIQVIVAAFTTGVSRVGTWNIGDTFTDNEVPAVSRWCLASRSPMVALAPRASGMRWSNQGTFEHVFAKLAKELDAVQMGDGRTALDHCLVVFGQEHGQLTHHTQGCKTYPLVTAGLAGGRVTAGKYIDFSDQRVQTYDASGLQVAKPGMQNEYAGLHYNQFLANCMLAMGIPRDEWETGKLITENGPTRSPSVGGYGSLMSGGVHYAAAEQVLSDPLPVFAQQA